MVPKLPIKLFTTRWHHYSENEWTIQKQDAVVPEWTLLQSVKMSLNVESRNTNNHSLSHMLEGVFLTVPCIFLPEKKTGDPLYLVTPLLHTLVFIWDKSPKHPITVFKWHSQKEIKFNLSSKFHLLSGSWWNQISRLMVDLYCSFYFAPWLPSKSHSIYPVNLPACYPLFLMAFLSTWLSYLVFFEVYITIPSPLPLHSTPWCRIAS